LHALNPKKQRKPEVVRNIDGLKNQRKTGDTNIEESFFRTNGQLKGAS
jgi:hypothetical protein